MRMYWAKQRASAPVFDLLLRHVAGRDRHVTQTRLLDRLLDVRRVHRVGADDELPRQLVADGAARIPAQDERNRSRRRR